VDWEQSSEKASQVRNHHHDRAVRVRLGLPDTVGVVAIRKLQNGVGQAESDIAIALVRSTSTDAACSHEAIVALRMINPEGTSSFAAIGP
jgi:hypothetical protein